MSTMRLLWNWMPYKINLLILLKYIYLKRIVASCTNNIVRLHAKKITATVNIHFIKQEEKRLNINQTRDSWHWMASNSECSVYQLSEEREGHILEKFRDPAGNPNQGHMVTDQKLLPLDTHGSGAEGTHHHLKCYLA